MRYSGTESPILSPSFLVVYKVSDLEFQLREKDGIIKALQDAFDKQLNIIKMLRDRIDEMTPNDIA